MKVNDNWLRITLIAIPSCLFLYDFIVSDNKTLQANIIYIISTVLVSEGSRFFIYGSHRWFKPPNKTFKRFLAFLVAIIFVSLVFIGSKAARNYLAYGETVIDAGFSFTLVVDDNQVKLGAIASAIAHGLFTFLI